MLIVLVIGTPVVLLPDGSVPVNSKVVEIINIVKPQAVELIDFANNVRVESVFTMWTCIYECSGMFCLFLDVFLKTRYCSNEHKSLSSSCL